MSQNVSIIGGQEQQSRKEIYEAAFVYLGCS